MTRESTMVSGLFKSKKVLLLVVLALMAVSVVYLIAGQQPTQVVHAQQMDPELQEKYLDRAVKNPKADLDQLVVDTIGVKLPENVESRRIKEKEELLAEVPRRLPIVKRKDTIDNSGAKEYLQLYARTFANDVSGVDPNKASTIQNWWQAAAMIDWYINSPIRYQCQDRQTVGNWHICQDPPYTVKAPCLVYSFGINFDFSFDDAMSKLGCEVHSFDPSMGEKTKKRGPNSTFHDIGLSNVTDDNFQPRKDMYVNKPQVWKMRTLKDVMIELGHENKVIDVLKIDIEGHEWAVIENIMENDLFKYVRQFMLEFHLFADWPAKQNYVHLYQIYTRLREMGFREYGVGPHPKTLKVNQFNNQGDSEYINVFFNQSGDL